MQIELSAVSFYFILPWTVRVDKAYLGSQVKRNAAKSIKRVKRIRYAAKMGEATKRYTPWHPSLSNG